MWHYLVSYDLHDQRNYPRIIGELQKLGANKLLESLWVLSTNQTAAGLRNHLNGFIDNDDSIVVIEIKVGSFWACNRAKTAGVNWLRQNIRS